MNQTHKDAWISMIRQVASTQGTTPIAVLDDLLKHAREDDMSEQDRRIVTEQLEALRRTH